MWEEQEPVLALAPRPRQQLELLMGLVPGSVCHLSSDSDSDSDLAQELSGSDSDSGSDAIEPSSLSPGSRSGPKDGQVPPRSKPRTAVFPFPRGYSSVRWKRQVYALKHNLSACFISVDIEALVQELQPGTVLHPTVCTEAQCRQNKSWLQHVDSYCRNLDCSAELKTLVNVAKVMSRVGGHWGAATLRGRFHLSDVSSRPLNFENLYTSLLKLEPVAGKVLQESLATAEDLDVTKVDLKTLAGLLGVYPPWKHYAVQHLTAPSQDFYTTAIRIVQLENVWYKREFLHAVLLSMKTKEDQVETFHKFRGDEILLPTSIDSTWVKMVKSMRCLLQEHVLKQNEILHMVMWFSPTMIKQFLERLAVCGYPHISRELGKHMDSRNIIRFRDGKSLMEKMSKEIDGGHYVDAADTSTESRPPKIQLHTKHWLSSDYYTNRYIIDCNFFKPSSSEPWLFRMAGALASEWRAVARDLGFSDTDIEKTALDPWYNHQHRMFHLLKRLTGEQSVKFTELCFLLLCKCKEYKCYRHLEDIIGAALPDANCSSVLSSQYIEQLKVGETESLVAFYKKDDCPTIKEISGKEFESFLQEVSLLGPVYDVHTPVKGAEVLLYLPSDASAKESVSASFLGESLRALSAVMSPDLFAVRLSSFLPEQRQETLYKFLVREEYDSVGDLMFTNSVREATLFSWVKTSSSLVRAWPQMYRHQLKLSSVRVGHIKDENLELLVPLTVTETHAVVLVNSCSPFVTLEKRLRNLTSRKAYFLLYKPVGRSYVDMLTLKVMLVPRCRSLLQELDKIEKDHKRMLKKQFDVHRNSLYRLQISKVKAAGTSLSISPEEAEEFRFVDNAEETLTNYEIKFNMEEWKTWPLMLELVENEKNIKIKERLHKSSLKAENGEYLYIRVNEVKYCVTRIHNEITYREIREAVEKVFPDGNFILTHKQNDLPLLIDGDLSLQSILQKEGNIILEANVLSPGVGITDLRHPHQGKPAVQKAFNAFPLNVPQCLANSLPRFPRPLEDVTPLLDTNFATDACTEATRRVLHVTPLPWLPHFIQKHEAKLIERLTEVDSILNGLKASRFINQYDRSKVLARSTIEDQVRELMTCVIKKGDKAMDYCHDLLCTYHRHLMSELEKIGAAE